MDTIESANLAAGNSDAQRAAPAGIFQLLRSLLQKFFGGSTAAVGVSGRSARSADKSLEIEEDDEMGQFVVAPGGYRVRVPQAGDVNNSVGEMLPSVKEGLNLLPPLPMVVVELLREIQDPRSTASSVAQVASSDPALAASLIRTVNSSASGLNRKITSVSEAVSYLGFCIVKSMVIRLRLDEVMTAKTEAGAQDAEDLWVHCLIVSYAAEQLATRVNDVDRGFVATLGLLHDVGKLAIVSQLPADALRLNAAPNDTAENSLVRERRLLGIDHAGIGADLAAKWKLPPDLIQAIRWHHRASEAFLPTDPPALRKALHIVQIANQLAKYCHCYADRIDIDVIPDEVFDLLGLERSMPKLLDEKMRAAISRAIYFADASSKRGNVAPRRFLRPLRGETAALIAQVDTRCAARIRSDEAAIAAMYAQDIALVDLNSTRPPKLTSGPARFVCQATVPGVEKCINAVLTSPDMADLTPDTRSSITIVIRSLLPNLLRLSSPSETIEVAKQPRGRGMVVAIRNAGLSFARRIPNYTPEGARRVAEAELANVLNLGWFKQIIVSNDGTTMMFASE